MNDEKVFLPNEANKSCVFKNSLGSFFLKYRFEVLIGDRRGQYSIRINDQWRVCFEWPEKSPGPVSVEIVDYH